MSVRVDCPDYSDVPSPNYDWMESIYGKVKEVIPKDAPNAYGPKLDMTVYIDAILYQGMITGRSLTGILHYLNQTPIDWYCKKQGTVKAAMYGSEFVAAALLRTKSLICGLPCDT